MFELEDYSSGFHEGFLSKYADSSGPTLDFYISDSMQDMLDIDIRSEIENVVGCGDPDFSSITSNLHHFLDQSLSGNPNISGSNSLNHNNATSNGSNSILQSVASTSSSSSALASNPWYCVNTGPSWSSSANNDYYADIGACVNPISVMPLISSTLLHKSPKANLNSSGLPIPPASPNAREQSKSHLTFSPAQMKISAGSIRHEQILSHIPKQIVAISSTVTSATTAPATLATNSALQRKVSIVTSSAIDAIKKDLGAELRRSSSADESIKSNILANNILNGSTTPSSTIKLAPGIGGLTFANSITYNKLKQQSTAKSPQGSPILANSVSSIVIKRDRDSSPMRTITTTNGQSVSKILARNMVQSANGFTPKSIASAHSPLIHNNGGGCVAAAAGGGSSVSIGSPSSSVSSMSASSPSSGSSGFNGSFSAGLAPLNAVGHNQSTSSSPITVKSLQQKINNNNKSATIESEYPKPAYSYSCLIAMALKNSRGGSLPVSEIYSFMCEHFPYFNTAPSGWKNSVRHNLSLNKCFEKIEKPATNGNQRKGCLWAMNPDRITKMDEEVQKWSRKDPSAIRNAMVYPEHLEALERGEMKHGSSADSEIELDSQSEIEDTSDLEEPEDIDETIVDSMFVEEEEEDEEDEEEDVDEEELMGEDNGIVVMNETTTCHDDGDGMNCGGGRDLVENDIDEVIDESELLQHQQQHRDQQQQQSDFDIEVEDFYDSIDIEDDKEAVRMAINQSDIIELSPADLNAREQSPKRARLDINYSIGPVGELEKHIQQQKQQQQQQQQQQQKQQQQLKHQQQQQQVRQPQQQQFKKFRFIQHHNQQQHFIVQAIPNGSATTIPTTTTANVATFVTSNNNSIGNKINNNNNIILPKQFQHIQHIQHVTAIPQHNRRKMQLVNRIA